MSPSKNDSGVAVLTTGFGVTVAMWAVGYFGRLPAVMLPSPLVLALLLACPFAGGVVLARRSGGGFGRGAAAGAVSGLLNLAVLGSFLSSVTLWWVPGSILIAGMLCGTGAAVGAVSAQGEAPAQDWTSAFAKIAVVAALLLLGVGGLVTSTGAGLAVVDWPNSFGYNMFLYPFSRMTGGIYYEHAHRLFGALVGLTTLALALLLQFRDTRRPIRLFAWGVFALVVLQGILGGLRVTGQFTLSAEPALMRPNLALAMVHGVLGQLFFAALVALAVFTAPSWRARNGGKRADLLGTLLIGAILGQLVLGAAQRHLSALLMAHLAVGIALVAPLTLHVGFRTWALADGDPPLQRLGLALTGGIAAQVFLGLVAYGVSGAGTGGRLEVGVTTAHQWFGAVLLGLAVMRRCYTARGPAPIS